MIPEPTISENQNEIPPTLEKSEETVPEDELENYDYNYDEYESEKPQDEKMSEDENGTPTLGVRRFQLG